MGQRVVFHIASLRGGGAERVFVLMANEFAKRGYAVSLFVWNSNGPNAALVSDEVEVIDLALPMRGGGFGKVGTLKGIWRSRRIIADLRPIAVYSAPEFANLLMALVLVLSGSKARFFPTIHASMRMRANGLGARLAIVLSRLVAWRATKAISVSQGVGRELVARGYPANKVTTINNPLIGNSAQSVVYGWQDELSQMGDGPVIGTAGQLIDVKDHMTLLRAFALVRERRPAKLVIFGEGPLRQKLVAAVVDLGLADCVLLPGYVNDPAACYGVMDLFVLTSTSEGFGNVLVEAMASGVPVVSTDAPHGPREILCDGILGPLVEVGNHQALAKAILRQLDHPTDAALLKQRASDFSADKIGDRYVALLQ